MKFSPIYLILLLILTWLLNYLASYFYMRKVNRQIIELKKRYLNTETFLGAVVEKVNIIRKVIIILVTDKSGNIIHCSYLYGFTNLSKFKSKKDIVGKNINDNEEFKEDKFYKAIKSCCEVIDRKIKNIQQ